jgi:hypothetical protein
MPNRLIVRGGVIDLTRLLTTAMQKWQVMCIVTHDNILSILVNNLQRTTQNGRFVCFLDVVYHPIRLQHMMSSSFKDPLLVKAVFSQKILCNIANNAIVLEQVRYGFSCCFFLLCIVIACTVIIIVIIIIIFFLASFYLNLLR